LRNHTVWACDFLQGYDIWFRPIFAFFVVDINSKRIAHVGVTRCPTAEWTAQQLRNITPFGEGPRFSIRDNDNKFGAQFDRVAKGAGMKVLRTAVQAPLMNAVCERFVGSARRECLDHFIIFGRRHMKHILELYGLHYFNTSRLHQGIVQQIPVPRRRGTYRKGVTVASVPILGGLHHDYQVAAWRRGCSREPGQGETISVLQPQANASGGWSNAELTESGQQVRGLLRSYCK